MYSFLGKSELFEKELVSLHPRMRSLRPIVMLSSFKVVENHGNMMGMKHVDDSIGHSTRMCGDSIFCF